jgi:hypothetical protein
MLKYPKSFTDYEDMLKKCRLLENQGKQTWDLDKKAELFLIDRSMLLLRFLLVASARGDVTATGEIDRSPLGPA